ncbi:SDR family oxidoreductase [Pontibaca methylaminivorans]|uniref:NAD(P)-dependent dehydrogenase, short-chain alcohol dehydrogenase family n=1 Tax=Pontibaca methylaminivorans TaxID=515897 RepID=A0A1R3WTR8_9RHOB|nr:SDR family oxidoreductase [Pontibaca methylaminivorans]SIT80742.1 NAD(P)-dependent dehydrogenase, short-chain alcohol dehydrogenase family [Pontibaca methylaminivorans]
MQNVLITAGASGIGRAMADAFAEAGARVWVVDSDAEALGTCPQEWRRDRLDVTDEASVADLFARLRAEWGGLDVLCANAGVAGPTALIEDQPPDGFRRCVAVNLEGAFLFTRAAAPLMKAAKRGAIIFTSSTAGMFGYPNRAPYSAAKWAVNGLMKTAAMELGPFGIRANSICPGSVEGPRMEGVLAREAAAKGTTRDAIYAGYASGTSMRSFVEAKDIAQMAVFLASDAARFVSGQIIAVDGHTENPDPKV